MTTDRAPVPVDPAQWPEARGFHRLYSKDPERQARLAMALIGFSNALEEIHRDKKAADAVKPVIQSLCQYYPELAEETMVTPMESSSSGEVYQIDDRLAYYLDTILYPEADKPDEA